MILRISACCVMVAMFHSTMGGTVLHAAALQRSAGLFYAQSASNALANTSWKLTELAGQPSSSKVTSTLIFGDEARANGNAGCNTFFGGFETDGKAIKFSQLGSTRMA